MTIRERLFEMQDDGYAGFQRKITLTVQEDAFIGVRIPQVRKLAKELVKKGGAEEFLQSLPHKYYDENILHGLIISEVKDYDQCIDLLEKFLPYVDNWGVCDTMKPRSFKKHRAELIDKIREWTASPHCYTCRFGLSMLMTHFLDEDFKEEYLSIAVAVHSEDYYVNMMVAWFFCTALIKQWDATIPYLENHSLNVWTHNRTLQKARESKRITAEQKAILRSLKRNLGDEWAEWAASYKNQEED